ncbi:hypothetical protein JCM8547_005542 [Rhodosporidiobolus lusitaniae]
MSTGGQSEQQQGATQAQKDGQAQEQEKQPPNRPHVCPHPGCGQAYSRIEHCERHAKTHDASNAYTCPTCGKSFARSDVLRRHTKIHSRENIVATDENGKGGKRCAKACRSCSTAKVRCSGETPVCHRCREANKPCEYDAGSGTEGTPRPAKRVRIESEPVEMAQITVVGGARAGDLLVSPEGMEDGGGRNASSMPPETSPISQAVQFTPSSQPLQLPLPPTLPPSQPSLIATSTNSLNDHWLAGPSSSSFFDVSLGPSAGSSSSAHLDASSSFSSSFPSSSAAALHQPVPSTSNSILDSVLSLAFQQQQLATGEAGENTIQDDLTAAFALPADNAFFWSDFLSSPSSFLPPPPPTSGQPAQDVPPSPAPSSTSSHRPRILITAAGLPSRHGSPRPEEGEADPNAHRRAGPPPPASSSRWPLAWNPRGDEAAVRLDGDAARSLFDLPLIGQGGAAPMVALKVDEQVRIALLETLRFSSLSDDEYHALYGTIGRLPLFVYDLLLGLYFHHFHPILPIFHLPSFNPKKTLSQLLLILLGIGAVYTPVAGALQLGRVLIEVARRGIEHLINRDNRLARSLPVAQGQMLWATMRWLGSARTIELAEVFRSIHTTMLRNQRTFDESTPREAASASPAAQWSAFIANEERRRTAMACFLLEGEVAALLHCPPAVATSDLKTLLPCPEALWNAPTAEAWVAAKSATPDVLAIPVLTKLLSSDSLLSLPATVSLSPFGAHVLVQVLVQNVYHVRQLHQCGMTSHAELLMIQLRRSLARLARGKHEFSPRFHSTAGANDADDPALYAAPHVWYHLAQIATYVPLEELDVVSNKATEKEAQQAKAKWTAWMSHSPESARNVSLHAGQITRITREHPTQGTYEASSLFYATVILYLYACSNKASSGIDDSLSWSTSTSLTPSASQTFTLDSDLSNSDPSTFLALGGPAALEAVSVPLTGSAAAAEVLQAGAALLRSQSAWPIRRVFANVLQAMAEKEDVAVALFGGGEFSL